MSMRDIDTDYLIIGSGAIGLAFADTLVAESDARLTIVDRHGHPGGPRHHADAVVTRHQPSAVDGSNNLYFMTEDNLRGLSPYDLGCIVLDGQFVKLRHHGSNMMEMFDSSEPGRTTP